MHIWAYRRGENHIGKMFAGAYLRGGYGGYVNCVKNDEVELCCAICVSTGAAIPLSFSMTGRL